MGVNNCKSDVYSFRLLLREVFPHRYRHIAAKCTCENPERRYADMEAVRKALERHDQRAKTLPLVGVLLLALALAFFWANKTIQQKIRFETTVDDMMPDYQRQYIADVMWQVNTMFHPISVEAEKGKEHLWHTPSRDDWVYLLFVRNTASGIRFAKAVVGNVPGLVLLPDHWRTDTYHLISFNSVELGFNNNVISLSDWQQVLEPAGAVFLPEAGVRTVDGVYPNLGYYQISSTVVDKSYMLLFGLEYLWVGVGAHRGDGMAVRLVREGE